MILATLFASLLFFGSVIAHPASPLAVATVKEQFKNALLVPDVLPTFDPTGLMSVNYSLSMTTFGTGDQVSRTNVTQPGYSIEHLIKGTEEGLTNTSSPYNDTSTKYTVLMFDAGYPGANKTSRYYLHYLQNDLGYSDKRHDTVVINGTSTPVVAYAAPNPPAGSGPHRYVWLVYEQESNFVAPSSPAVGSGVALWNFQEYISASKLGNPIAGTYFTVQEGSATVSVTATSSVNNTTLPQYTPTSSTSASSTAAASSSKNSKIVHPGMIALGLACFTMSLAL